MGMPSWLENIVFYEIYPQTFLDTDGDGIGNIQGIIRKLDYIKNLGCDGIWLNPCFASPFYDAGLPAFPSLAAKRMRPYARAHEPQI